MTAVLPIGTRVRLREDLGHVRAGTEGEVVAYALVTRPKHGPDLALPHPYEVRFDGLRRGVACFAMSADEVEVIDP